MDLRYKSYAAKIILESSQVAGDAIDDERYYRLEAGSYEGSGAYSAKYSVKDESGTTLTFAPTFALKGVDTQESLNSEQGASLSFNGGAELAIDLKDRIQPMDRLRIELTSGTGFFLAFDGFVTSISSRSSSTPESYSTDFSITANGLWKFLTQSWFNWQGVIQPGYDISFTKKGVALEKWLRENEKRSAQDIIKAFIETALSLVELRVSEGLVQPGKFFQFGSDKYWKSAFDLAYPIPSSTLPSWKGPLVGMIQMLAQPDIHECFCTYMDDGVADRPTIIFRPRPFPGPEGDDENWKALKYHIIDTEAAKSIASSRSDAMHPNAFHIAQGASSDGSLTEHEQKLLHGCFVDMRSIKRFGYSARPVASSLPPLSFIQKSDRGKFVDTLQKLMQRIAYQEAPLHGMTTRTIQLPLHPGIHPGEVIVDYSEGVPWTGYVSTVQHRLTAMPWGGTTSIGMVRCLQCTFEEYPEAVRQLVDIQFKSYIVPKGNGAADMEEIKLAQKNPRLATDPSAQPYQNVPFGKAIIAAANTHGVPPWVLAHMLHIESSFGTRDGNGGGVMQFLPGTANDLNNQGYDRPFSIDIARKDPIRSIDAAGWYINKQRMIVDEFAPDNLTEQQRWQWALYGYNQGLGINASRPVERGWAFNDSDKALREYGIYWGTGAVQQAQAAYGGLK